MRALLLLSCSLLIVTRGLSEREFEERDRREKPQYNVQKTIEGFCISIRDTFLRGQVQVQNAEHLSVLIVQEFDLNQDRCISNNEIRDLSARFRGDLFSYRMLFENTLDEDRSGCVEASELNPLVLDCVIPSASWIKGNPDKFIMPFDDEERHRALQQQYEAEHQSEAVLVEPLEQKEEEEEEEEEEELSSDEEMPREDEKEESVRPVVLPAPIKFNNELTGAMKEMLCSSTRERFRDQSVEEGLRALVKEGDSDQSGSLNFDEVFEILSWLNLDREETNDIAKLIDCDSDALVTYDELYRAVDGCPVPEQRVVPVVNTRPMVNLELSPCPEPSVLFKQLQTRVARFGSDLSKFGTERDVVTKLYADIAGDMEEMISPEELDVPLHCVKETLGGLDANKDGFIDLQEFSGIAFDLIEQFMPAREVRPQRVSIEPFSFENSARLEKYNSVLLGSDEVHERSYLGNDIVFEIISEAAFKILSQQTERSSKETVYHVTGLLMENKSIIEAVRVLSEGDFTRAVKKTAGLILEEVRNMGY